MGQGALATTAISILDDVEDQADFLHFDAQVLLTCFIVLCIFSIHIHV